MLLKRFVVITSFLLANTSQVSAQSSLFLDSVLSNSEKISSTILNVEKEISKAPAWERVREINEIPQKSNQIKVEKLDGKLSLGERVEASLIRKRIKHPTLFKRDLFQMTENSSLNFKYLDARNGLLTDEILGVAFDSSNNVWAISSGKLLRLSGTFVEEYGYGQGMPDMRPTDILTSDEFVVLSTWGQGLLILKEDTLLTLDQSTNFPTNHIFSLKKFGQLIYFIDSKNHLYQFNLSDFSTQEVLINNKPVFASSLHASISSLSFITDKGVLCSMDKELECYRFYDEERIVAHYVINERTYSLTESEELIYGFEGTFNVLKSPLLEEIRYIFPAKSGSVWIVTKNHLLLVVEDKIKRSFKTNFKLASMKVTEIRQDKMSNLWIASSNAGLGLIAPSFFGVVEYDESLINSESDFLHVNDSGEVFREYKDGGLVKKDPDGNFSVLRVPKMKNLTSSTGFQGSQFISGIGGLFKLDSNKITSYQFKSDNGLNSHLELESSEDYLFINNYNYGLIKFDGEDFINIKNTSTLTFDSYLDEKNRLWVANDDKGISVLSKDSVGHMNLLSGFVSNRVNSISGNHNGKVLAATNRGLFFIDKEGKVRELLKEEPGSKDYRNCFYLKGNQEFWVSNEINLYAISFKESEPIIRKFSRNNFTSVGQIKENSFIGHKQSLFFKTGESIVKYSWFHFSYLDIKPVINLKNINIRSEQYSKEELEEKGVIQYDHLSNQAIPVGLKLKPGRYNLSFIYDVNLWGSEEKLNFFYRLKGFSDSWIGPVDNRTIEYTNLPYGEYQLEVKTYLDGEVRVSDLVYPFSIEKYFYQEYYFLFLIIIVTLIGIFILIKTFSKLSFSSLDSYTSFSALVNKTKIISILALLLIPSVAFYESEILNLYQANWFLVSVICISSFATFLSSFYKGHTAKTISVNLSVLYFLIVGIIFHISFEQELNATLVAESSILLLFSRLVFRKFKHLTWSFVGIFLFLILEALYWNPDQTGLSILISTTILCTVVVVCIILVEGNSVNNLSFANKILRDSDLFVLVSDLSGKIVYVSEPLLRITEKEESDLLGEGWWNFRKPNAEEKFDLGSNIREVIEKSKTPKYINQLETSNGLIDIEWSDFSLEDKFVISIGKDITNELKYQKETEMLSLVATSVTNGVLISNAENEALWFNNQFRELVGLEDKKIIGKDAFELILPTVADSREIIKDASFIQENKTQTIRIRANNRSNERYILLTNSIVYSNEKTIEKKIFVWTDISTQYKIEKRYKDIINNAFDSIYTANYRGEFTYVNKSMETKLKMTTEELIGRSFISLVHPADKEETEAFYQRQFDNLQLYSYHEFRMVGANTEELWVGQSVRLVLDPYSKQKVIELHAVARDITESKKNREELTRLSYVASNTENIVIILDKAFDIVWVNDAFSNVFGYKLEEVLGRNPGDILNGRKTDSDTIAMITSKLVERKHVSVELLNYDKYGHEKWININMDPIFDENGKLINYIAVEDDITERKSQQLLIQEQHDSIIDSLNYSSIIQEAALPSKKEIEKINPETFIYYRPKDIIGGDFYLVDTLINDFGNAIEVYIVADCTGHGVPGAMLSVLCTGLLKEAINRPETHNPAQALDYTRRRLMEIFSDNDKQTINDGMDVCFLVVDRVNQTLDYAGANRPLYIVKGDQIEVIKGHKQSVGFNYRASEFTYVTKKIEIGDQLYLFSDGIIDQFGGEKTKKFMSSRFKRLLLQIRHKPMEEQKKEIDKVLIEWQGSGEQTDDICLMGIKL